MVPLPREGERLERLGEGEEFQSRRWRDYTLTPVLSLKEEGVSGRVRARGNLWIKINYATERSRTQRQGMGCMEWNSEEDPGRCPTYVDFLDKWDYSIQNK
jgi:hypothetical protein